MFNKVQLLDRRNGDLFETVTIDEAAYRYLNFMGVSGNLKERVLKDLVEVLSEGQELATSGFVYRPIED